MKNKEHIAWMWYPPVAVLVVCAIVVLIYSFQTTKEESISVGAVFIGTPDDKGWNEGHYLGIRKACEEQSCMLHAKTNVPEDEESLKQAVAELVSGGCSCIFLTSFGYGQYMDEIARTYPKVAFYGISGDGEANNCMCYFVRIYQARYLTGIVAGEETKSDLLGYVTSNPISETIRSINAYALGARKVNPQAKVLVVYTGSWNDEEAEKEAVYELKAAGVDVITYHEDTPRIIDYADEMGMCFTGYGTIAKEYSDRLLTAAIINWDVVYQRALIDFLSGRANFSSDYWLGLSEGAVSLLPCSDRVTDETRGLVKSEAERIQTWRDVFSGEIRDNTGSLRCDLNERIGDYELFYNMDWYVEGVEVYE